MIQEPYRVLLVDDEPDILQFVGYNLRKEGFEVSTANNGIEAIAQAQEIQPHLILMDVMMPEMDGIEACAEIRNIPTLKKTFIVFLTARSEDYSQIAGFDAGADDYVTKPVRPQILITRIKSMMRRLEEEEVPSHIISIKNLTINHQKFLVYINGKVINLTKKEFDLLSFLANKPNRVFTRPQIFSAIWGNDVIVGDRTIDVHIRRIREKLNVDYLKTIKGVGYKFES